MNIIKSKGILLSFCGAISLVLTGGPPAQSATQGSHYPPGGEGVMAASVPPPGFHYRIYNAWYNSTTIKDDNGDDLDIDFDLDVFCMAHRFVHVTQKKILGADYFYNIIVPLEDKDISINGMSDSNSLSLGDVVFEPLGLAWHKPRWDGAIGLAVIAPTGEYDADKPASPGLGYWSGMLTIGGTIMLDEQRSWSVSALTRTLINSEQEDTKVTPGAEFLVEYGIGKEIPINDKLVIRPGIAGWAYWQIADDSDDGPTSIADEAKEAYALGAEINFFWLPPTLFQMNLRVLREFGVENSVEGSQFWLTLTKSW